MKTKKCIRPSHYILVNLFLKCAESLLWHNQTMGWFELEGTLKIIQFRPSMQGLDQVAQNSL